MDPILAGALGGLIGLLAGLIPGLHSNLLAALLAGTGEPALLMGMATAATVSNILPATLLGAPTDDGVLLPARRLAVQGRARAAIQAGILGSLTGVLVGASVAFVVASRADWLLALDPLVPYLLILALLVMLWTEPAGRRRALLVQAASAAVALLVFGLPAHGPLPGGVLGPWFMGLFGLHALLDTLGGTHDTPRGPGVQQRVTGLAGVPLGIAGGLLPGLTAGPASAVLASVHTAPPVRAVAAMSAIDSTIVTVATGVLVAAGRARTGAHAIVATLGPPSIAPLIAAQLAAAVVAAIVVLTVGHRIPVRPFMLRGMLLLLPVMAWAQGGVAGLAVFVTAAVLGAGVKKAGVRRGQAMASILAPAILARLG